MFESSKVTSKNAAMKVDSLNLLLISPSLDWRSERIQKKTMRVEKDAPNQESHAC